MVKKYKKDDNVSYALGATLVMELLNKKPTAASCVYISPKSNVDAVIKRAAELNVPTIVSEKAFNILSPKDNCYAIGVFDKFEGSISHDKNHVVLVNPSDMGNLGTIMRTAVALDYELAIIRPAADPFDPKTVRASMGAVFDVGFEMFDSFAAYENKYGGRKIIPFMLDGAPLGKYNFDGSKCALVFGNEATGLPPDFLRYGAVKIEQSDRADSLNLSIAAAIGMYKLGNIK